LRAISVFLVVLFHLGNTGVSGGFIGVDVFFVISGYLISGILIDAMRTGKYSLLWFYERRIRRIVPALLAMIVFCLVVGYFLLTPGDYQQTGRSAFFTIIASSNVFFLNNTGYFDKSAELMPLLHTWSLGVEEEFYLFWPLLLAVLFRLCHGSRNGLRIGILCFALVSFGLNLWQIETSPKATFFLPHTRSWELAVGALLVLLPSLGSGRGRHFLAELMPMAGIALIVWSGLNLSQSEPYPGAKALFPVLGAALVIYANGYQTVFGRLLGTGPIVFFGSISYSVYLWHWPLIVFWRHYTNGAAFTPVETAAIALGSIFMGWVSWRWVEQPFRRPVVTRKTVFAGALAGALAVSAAILAVVSTDGFPNRISPEAQALGDNDAMWTWSCPQSVPLNVRFYTDPTKSGPLCAVGANWQTARTHAVVWGDSNTEHLMPLLDRAGREKNVSIAVITPCPAILHQGVVSRYWAEVTDYSERCTALQDSVLEMLEKNPDISLVLLAARWSNLPWALFREPGEQRSTEYGLKLMRSGFDSLLAKIPAGRQVVLINDIPGIPVADPAACELSRISLVRRKCDIDFDAVTWGFLDSYQRPVHELLRSVASAHPNVAVYDPEDYLCSNQRCMTSLNGEFLYRDRFHIRRNLTSATERQLVDLLHLPEMLSPTQTSDQSPAPVGVHQ